MPNWVHNGVTVKGPAKVIFGMAEYIVDKSVAIDEEDQQRGPTSRRIAPKFEKRYQSHPLAYGTLRDIVFGSKEYEEFNEIIDEVLVDFDTEMMTPSPDLHRSEDGKNVYEWPEEEDTVKLLFRFDTKWKNQPALFCTALLELALQIDPELGKECMAFSSASEELLHFENACMVVNKLKVNDEWYQGPHLLYQSYTHRNSLVREDEMTKEPDLQIFEMKLDINEDPSLVASSICESVRESGFVPSIDWTSELITDNFADPKDGNSYHYITFKCFSDQLLAGRFYQAMWEHGYSIYTSEKLDSMPYIASPYFMANGQVLGNVVPVEFGGSEVPTFVYGERFVEWFKNIAKEEINHGMPF